MEQNSRLAATVLEDAETRIRLTIRDEYLKGKNRAQIMNRVQRMIGQAVAVIAYPALKKDAANSLMALARRQLDKLASVLGANGKYAAAMIALAASRSQARYKAETRLTENSAITYETAAKGIPNGEYARNYMVKVRAAFESMANDRALDPGDVSGRNSLKNLAEMETRYNGHLARIDELKANGVKLVISSVHADCSDRCYPYQGRVYSLDGTSGRAPDGKQYEPLEHATDIYYTTKSGKTYKNGLLGFNCRHALTEYQPGMAIPTVSKEQQAKEREITKRQRAYEKQIRNARERALLYRGVDDTQYRNARNRALKLNAQYKAYSRANKRAFYPDRTKVLIERGNGRTRQ